jgi:hypothetical protein
MPILQLGTNGEIVESNGEGGFRTAKPVYDDNVLKLSTPDEKKKQKDRTNLVKYQQQAVKNYNIKKNNDVRKINKLTDHINALQKIYTGFMWNAEQIRREAKGRAQMEAYEQSGRWDEIYSGVTGFPLAANGLPLPDFISVVDSNEQFGNFVSDDTMGYNYSHPAIKNLTVLSAEIDSLGHRIWGSEPKGIDGKPYGGYTTIKDFFRLMETYEPGMWKAINLYNKKYVIKQENLNDFYEVPAWWPVVGVYPKPNNKTDYIGKVRLVTRHAYSKGKSWLGTKSRYNILVYDGHNRLGYSFKHYGEPSIPFNCPKGFILDKDKFAFLERLMSSFDQHKIGEYERKQAFEEIKAQKTALEAQTKSVAQMKTELQAIINKQKGITEQLQILEKDYNNKLEILSKELYEKMIMRDALAQKVGQLTQREEAMLSQAIARESQWTQKEAELQQKTARLLTEQEKQQKDLQRQAMQQEVDYSQSIYEFDKEGKQTIQELDKKAESLNKETKKKLSELDLLRESQKVKWEKIDKTRKEALDAAEEKRRAEVMSQLNKMEALIKRAEQEELRKIKEQKESEAHKAAQRLVVRQRAIHPLQRLFGKG